MDSPVNRDNLAELVEQFLKGGGAIAELPVTPRKARKPRRTAASLREDAPAVKEKRRPIGSIDPFKEPISLRERALLPEVQRGIAAGLTLVELMKESGISRASILRIAKEYGLVLAQARKPKLDEQQIIAMIAAGLEAGKSLTSICLGARISPYTGRKLYNQFLKDSSCSG